MKKLLKSLQTSNQQPETRNQKPETSNQKSILMLLTNAFDPDPRVYQEATALIEDGYKVSILCWDRDYKALSKEEIDGIHVERIYIKSTHGRGSSQILFLVLFWLKALMKVLSKQFNVIYCHDFDTLPLGFIISRIKKVNLIYDAHESYVDMLANNVNPFIRKAIFFTENYLLKKIDLLITVGETLRDSFLRRGTNKAVVVGNWKQVSDFQIPLDELQKEKRRLGIPKNKLIISYIAHLHPEREVEPLLEAIKEDQDVFLIIGGNGPLEPKVIEAAKKNKNIVFLGFVHPKKIPLYTSLSDVIYYGFDKNNPNAKYSAPNKLFEALAAGKAIISGNFGEISHIVQKYKCGVILKDYFTKELQKALIFLKNRENLTQCQNNSLKLAKSKYNWELGKQIFIAEIEKITTSSATRLVKNYPNLS